jgi:hypothetical protein
MFILLFLIVLSIVYVGCFKEEFTKENIDKVMPVLFIAIGIFVVFILLSVVFGGV